MGKPIRRIIIIRRDDDKWDVVRERDGDGETLKGLSDLEECFAAVRVLYGADGRLRAEEQP